MIGQWVSLLLAKLGGAHASRTARVGIWLFVTGSLGSALSFVYHFAMGRMLVPGDYATLVSLIALFNLVLSAFRFNRAVVSDFTTRFTVAGAPGRVKGLLFRFSWILLGLATLIVLIFSAARQQLLTFFHLPSFLPLGLMLATVALVIVMQAGLGVLQGQQLFIPLGFTVLLGDVVQLVSGLILVGMVGWGLTGAVGGLLAASLAVFGGANLFLVIKFWRVPRVPAGVGLQQGGQYTFQVAMSALALTLLTNMDTLLARYVFPPDIAGGYSAVATLGNAVLFIGTPVLLFFFPRAGEQHARGQAGTPMLRRTMLVVGLLAGCVVLMYWLIPQLILTTLYGARYQSVASLLGWYGLAMAGFSLTAVLRLHYQARHDWRFVWLMIVFGLVQAALLTGLRLDAVGFVAVLMVSSWSLLAISELWLGALRGAEAGRTA